MKKVILIIVTFITLTSAPAQKWEHSIGEPNQNETSQRLVEHYDKGYIITGDLWGGSDETHGLLIKTDINGNVLWDKVLGVDPDILLLNKTIYDTDGNLYTIGTLKQGLPNEWPVAIKLNACGEKQWCKMQYFADHDYGFFSDAILLDNGDLLALALMPNDDQVDMVYLFCIAPDGSYKWKKSYASKADYPLFGVRSGESIQKFDDMYIISGYVYTPYPGPDSTQVYLRPMFIGIDTFFNEQWVLDFGKADSMLGKAHSSIAINDSLFMGTGRHRYYDTTGATKDAWAMFYNDQGEEVGYTTITKDKLGWEEINESTLFGTEKFNDSLYIGVMGYFYGEDDTYAKGEIIFDSAGNVYKYTIREGTAGNSTLINTYDGKYTIATSWRYPDLSYDVYLYKINDSLEHEDVNPGNFTYDSLCTELPIQSGIIDLTGCDIVTDIKEIPTLEEYNNRKNSILITAFPNPTSDGSITFNFQNTEYFQNMELKCFDVFGKEVHSEKVYQFQGESILDIHTWQPGVYFTIVYSNGKSVGECKFVVQ